MANDQIVKDQPGEITAMAREVDACVAELDRLLDDGVRVLARLMTLRDRASAIGQRIEGRPRLVATAQDTEQDNGKH